MKTFQGRAAEPRDGQNYADWLEAASDINLYDPNTYSYPTCNTITIDKDGEPVLMNSVHLVLVQEALAPKPGISNRDEARALLELFTCIRNLALASGIKEVWFSCADPSLEQFILRKGFEKISVPTFRMKLGGATDPIGVENLSPEGKQSEASCS